MRERSSSTMRVVLVNAILVTGVLSYTAGLTSAPAMAEPDAPIRAIQVTDLDDRIHVELDGAGTLPYAVTSSRSATGVTLQLTGAVKAPDLQRMDVGKPPLAQIETTELQSPQQVNVHFQLTSAVKPVFRRDGGAPFGRFSENR